MEEDGGVNIYWFVENDSLNNIDYIGLWSLNFAVDHSRSFGSRGVFTLSARANLENGTGIFSVGGSLSYRMYFTELVPGGTVAGTILGVFLERHGVSQEIRIGGGLKGEAQCKCVPTSSDPHVIASSSVIVCEITKAAVFLRAQGRFGYSGRRARAIGTASFGGEWDLITGDVSLTGSWSVRAQWRRWGSWVGWERGRSGGGLTGLSLPALLDSGTSFSIPTQRPCNCPGRDLDGSRELISLFNGN
jgi:hypothetical protein